MEFVPTLAMALLVVAIINLVKFVRARDTNGIVTTLSVWVAGVLVILLVGETDFADGVDIAGRTLAEYNLWSKVFIGLTISSVAQFANDIRGAIDNTATTAKPKLVAPGNDQNV